MLPYLEKGLLDVIKDFEMRSSWIIRVGLQCHHKCPCKREEEGDVTHTEKAVKWRRDVATSQGVRVAGEGRAHILQSLCRDRGPCLYFDFRLLDPRTVRE